MQTIFSVCPITHWNPGFNDPYPQSWIMVAVYLFAAALAFAVARRVPFPDDTRRREKVFWVLIASVLVFLAVNKQADLQSILLAIGRCLLSPGDAHGGGRDVARIVVIAIALAALVGGSLLLWSLRKTLKRSAWPLIGAGLMLSFIVFRAAEILRSLGPLQAFIHGLWTDRILELSGPLVILVSAFLLLRKHPRNQPSSPGPNS